MFGDKQLQDHLATSSVVKSQSAVIAEWNMNNAENLFKIGNYRYRPGDGTASTYGTLINSFDENDEGSFYTNATDSDIIIDGGLNDDNTPAIFVSKKEKERLLYSLEDCFYRNRPRSGINKLRYFPGKFTHHENIDMAKRPRYYMAAKDDKFKYWTSYRTESGIERGVSSGVSGLGNLIDDAAPFVVYKEQVPANRIIVKMQTNVGTLNLGTYANSSTTYDDPFFGEDKQTTPVRWKIQYLENNIWIDAISFNEASTRLDGSSIIKADGYVELSYGLIIPKQFRDIFFFDREYANAELLPAEAILGQTFLVKESELDAGIFYIWTGDSYTEFDANYGWSVEEEGITRLTPFVKDLTSPDSYVNQYTGQTEYREFKYIKGLRIVVESMNIPDCTFDLIELSPRLLVDLSDKTSSFSLTKVGSDLGISGMPVGQLLASTGSIELFDYDQAFSPQNQNSIVKNYVLRNIKFTLYEVILDVNASDYYVPLKTMYSDGFPATNSVERKTTVQLRDLFYYFESMSAPQIFIQEASLSYAVSLLLDSIGFSNYVFKRIDGETEPIIPNFFISPNKTIAEILNELAVSAQTAMFFDEYNNLIMMSKNYIMPEKGQRSLDMTLYGSKDYEKSGVLKNSNTNINLANIIDISSEANNIYNDGKINYQTSYIQKSVGKLKQAEMIDFDKTWIYKPALLWEVSPSENTKSINEELKSQAAYVLGAIPINSDLSSDIPIVSNGEVINNIIDLGEAIFFLPRYNGYFYANGEIIKYDAVEYTIPGLTDGENFWVNSVQVYQNYFSKIPFNGKMYPTGRVRIYSEPNYETINSITRLAEGAVSKHGRGQFGTEITSHFSGLDPHWSDDQHVRGIQMNSAYLFGDPNVTRLTIAEGDEIVGGAASKPNRVFISFEDISLVRNIKVGDYLRDIPGTKLTRGVVSNRYETRVLFVNPGISPNEDDGIIGESPYLDLTANINQIAGTDFEVVKLIFTETAAAGIDNETATKTTRNGIVRNFLSSSYPKEQEIVDLKATKPGTVQSSALIMTGPKFPGLSNARNFMSYVYKPLTDQFRHFGCRMRILGTINSGKEAGQNATGSIPYYYSTPTSSRGGSQRKAIYGSSGGLAVMVNPETNVGYYFELAALSSSQFFRNSSVAGGSPEEALERNVLFYKIKKNVTYDYQVTTNLDGIYSQNTLTSRTKTYLNIGGQTPRAGEIVYLSNQTNSYENGYYKVIDPGKTPTQNIWGNSTGSGWKLDKSESLLAMPVRLWSGNSLVLVDGGIFSSQARSVTEENPTVYDLGVEYVDVGSIRKFYLYINNRLVATVDDPEPLPKYNNMGVFTRASSRVAFENLYALTENNALGVAYPLDLPLSDAMATAISDDEIDTVESFRKYGMSGLIQRTYLSGLSVLEPPKYKMYFEEFGTIMREMAYFNIRYDKAYPALFAKISPTFNRLKGYVASGFVAGAYGAEFLVFNSTDAALNLDETTGNYLRIQGITFTQQSTHELTVDEYYSKKTDFSNPENVGSNIISSPIKSKQEYQDIKNSRITYGRNEFSLSPTYIQSQDDATDLMKWMLSKLSKPRKSVGVQLFATPTLQIGDLVNIDYQSDNVDQVLDISSKFIVYQIDYSKDNSGPSMTAYLSEVI